eukprot:COSAG01_NODE_1800_length_9205_cov_18.778058_8_plen_612_part_00
MAESSRASILQKIMPPSLVLASLLACAVAPPPPETTAPLNAPPPPWGAALLARVHAMEEEITVMKTTIAIQTDRLNEQSQTIKDHSSRLKELEVGPAQPDGRASTPAVRQQPCDAVEARLRSVEAQCANLTSTSARTARRLEEDDSHSYVTQHFAAVTLASGSVGTGSVGGGGGHRRTQEGGGSCANFNSRASAVQAECCDEPTEDCSSGAPTSCNADCAAVFLPFWADCGAQLTTNLALYHSVVAQCQAAGSGGVGSHNLAHQFDLVCANSTVTSCVPACSAALRGDLLLMNLNGEDSKYSCELHHGLHSWVGAATDGGYLGSDARALVSAVLSGAAGYYALALTGDAGVATDLIIRPGQDVRITGGGASAPTWGSGSFTVQQGGSLEIVGVTLAGSMTVKPHATLYLSGARFVGNAYDFVVETGAVYTRIGGTDPLDAQCSRPYTTVRDSWRSIREIPGQHSDCSSGTGVGGGALVSLRWRGWRRAGAGRPGLYALWHARRGMAVGLGGWRRPTSYIQWSRPAIPSRGGGGGPEDGVFRLRQLLMRSSRAGGGGAVWGLPAVAAAVRAMRKGLLHGAEWLVKPSTSIINFNTEQLQGYCAAELQPSQAL